MSEGTRILLMVTVVTLLLGVVTIPLLEVWVIQGAFVTLALLLPITILTIYLAPRKHSG